MRVASTGLNFQAAAIQLMRLAERNYKMTSKVLHGREVLSSEQRQRGRKMPRAMAAEFSRWHVFDTDYMTRIVPTGRKRKKMQ
jgi:hypothetical protein